MRAWLALLAVLVPAGASAQAARGLQEIFGYRVSDQELVVRVPTGGCTGKASFRVRTQLSGGDRLVRLSRVRIDECKGYFPEGVEIRFARGEFPPRGRLQVVNPVRLLPRMN